jgi:hypothetical protein
MGDEIQAFQGGLPLSTMSRWYLAAKVASRRRAWLGAHEQRFSYEVIAAFGGAAVATGDSR